MMNKTAIQIQSRDFPDGYLIVVVATESDDFCQITKEINKCGDRTKNLEKRIRITESVNTNSETTLKAVFVMIGIYAVIGFVSLGLSSMLFSYDINLFEDMKGYLMEINKTKRKKSEVKNALPFINPGFEMPEVSQNQSNGNGNIELKRQDSYILAKGDVPDASAVNISRLKSTLYVSDLCEKLEIPERSKSVYQKSNYS